MSAKTLIRWRDLALATAAFATVFAMILLPRDHRAVNQGGSSALVAASDYQSALVNIAR